MAGQWIRLDVKMMLVGWTSKLPAEQYAAWVKLLQAVKAVGKRGGSIRRCYFDDEQLSIWRMTKNAFETMISLARSNDAITIDKDGVIFITGWKEYQLDPTGSERVARHRAKDVTVTPVGNACNGDGRVQDVTGQDIQDTNKPKKKAVRKKRKKKDDFPEIPGHLKEVWKDWEQHRRDKRKPLTPLGVKKQLKMLGEYNKKTQVAMIDQTIASGWQGIFPVKGGDAQSASSESRRIGGNRPQTVEDFMQKGMPQHIAEEAVAAAREAKEA